MNVQLDKIIIFCADVERLVKFYCEHFGLAISGEPDNNWTVLDAGNSKIAFHKIGEQFIYEAEDHFVTDTNVKLVFRIDSDITLFRQAMIEKGVDVGEIKQFTGNSYLLFDGKDPEGNVFQIIADNQATTISA